MTPLLLPLIALGLVCPGAMGCSAPTQQQEGHLLRYKLKAGESLIYLQEAVIRAVDPGKPATKDSPGVEGIQETTLKVTSLEKGAAHIETYVRAIPAGKKREEVTDPPELTLSYDQSELGETGKVVNAAKPDAKKPSRLYGLPTNLQAFASVPLRLPVRAVKLGDEWQSSAPNPLVGGDPGQVFAKFASIEQIAEQRCAKLQISVAYPIKLTVQLTKGGEDVTVTGTFRMEGVIHFGLESGRLVQSKLSGDGVLTLGDQGDQAVAQLTLKSSMQLVK